MIIYQSADNVGYWDDGAVVIIDTMTGLEVPLNPRIDLANHSPTGFAWGYGGSGPAQLALAILADAAGATTALRLYQDFKWDIIAPLDKDQGFSLTRDEVVGWLISKEVKKEDVTND